MQYPKKYFISYTHEKSVRMEAVDAHSKIEAWLKVISKLSPEETLKSINVEEKTYG